MKIKKSYGICLCRKNLKNDNNEILLIQKRNSYYFIMFVLGHYKKNDDKYLLHLFNNMTYDEKITLITLDFEHIWEKTWLENLKKKINKKNKIVYKQNEQNDMAFLKKRKKFESSFLIDNGRRLKYLINKSSNSESIWEIPKGHKKTSETNIDAAIREFYEETLTPNNLYNVLWHVNPIVESYIDNNIIYKNTYYLASTSNNTWEPKVSFNCFKQVSEVQDIKWISITNLKFLKLDIRTKNRLIKLYKNAIYQFQKYKKTNKINNIITTDNDIIDDKLSWRSIA